MKKLKILLYLLIFTTSILAQPITIKIIETTDVHGAIFPFNFKNDRPSKGSLAQVSSMLKIERANKNQEIILLDNGDFLQGTSAVYYYNFEKPDVKHLYAEVMNYMKYDAGSIGNHDIETGHGVYDKFKKEINFPWLSANATDVKNGGTYFEPYSIVERSGVKIAILGLTTPGIPNWLPPKIFEGIDFEDMIKSAEKWIPIIKKKENPDIIVGLFHSGVEFTYGGYKADSPRNENAAGLIAERIAGFDVIFVGHDHHGWNKSVKNPNGKDVLILGATSRARNVAVANIVFDKDKNKLVSVEGELIEMSNYKPDEEFQLKFEPQFDEIKKYVSQPLGKFKSNLDLSDALFGPSKFTELINNIQTELTNADISFTAPLSFNAKIDSGTIYVRDMFKLYHYENLLYTVEMTGYEIKNYLEYTAELWFNKMVDNEDHLIKFKKDKDGKIIYSERTGSPSFANSFYNFDAGYGINYTIDITKPVGEKITIFGMREGNFFYFDKKYKVAINSYRGNGGGGHLVKGAKIPKEELAKRIISSTEKDLRFYIMKWIEKEKEVEINSNFNWKVIPEDLWIEGKDRDYKLFFR